MAAVIELNISCTTWCDSIDEDLIFIILEEWMQLLQKFSHKWAGLVNKEQWLKFEKDFVINIPFSYFWLFQGIFLFWKKSQGISSCQIFFEKAYIKDITFYVYPVLNDEILEWRKTYILQRLEDNTNTIDVIKLVTKRRYVQKYVLVHKKTDMKDFLKVNFYFSAIFFLWSQKKHNIWIIWSWLVCALKQRCLIFSCNMNTVEKYI